jgi:hypothetical protein
MPSNWLNYQCCRRMKTVQLLLSHTSVHQNNVTSSRIATRTTVTMFIGLDVEFDICTVATILKIKHFQEDDDRQQIDHLNITIIHDTCICNKRKTYQTASLQLELLLGGIKQIICQEVKGEPIGSFLITILFNYTIRQIFEY